MPGVHEASCRTPSHDGSNARAMRPHEHSASQPGSARRTASREAQRATAIVWLRPSWCQRTRAPSSSGTVSGAVDQQGRVVAEPLDVGVGPNRALAVRGLDFDPDAGVGGRGAGPGDRRGPLLGPIRRDQTDRALGRTALALAPAPARRAWAGALPTGQCCDARERLVPRPIGDPGIATIRHVVVGRAWRIDVEVTDAETRTRQSGRRHRGSWGRGPRRRRWDTRRGRSPGRDRPRARRFGRC